MSTSPTPLEYATKARSAWRPFYVFVLSLLWLPAGIGSRIHYGDEYGPFIVAQMPALPILYVLQHFDLGIDTLFLLGMTFNFMLMIATGLLMDRLRVPRSWILLLPLLVLAMILSRWFVLDGVPPRQTPWPANVEWEPVFMFPAWAWGVYVLALTSLTGAATWRTLRRCAGRSR